MSHIRADSGPAPSAAAAAPGTPGHRREASHGTGHTQRGVTFKVLVLGDSAVGKTCIINRTVHGTKGWTDIHATTLGVDMQKKELRVGGELVKLQIWDTAGQERFRSIAANYYRGAHGVLVCYDVTRRESFRSVKSWLASIAANSTENCELVLIGNKCDVEAEEGQDCVLPEEGEALAAELGIPFFQTSAFTGQNIDAVFESLASRIYATYARRAGLQSGPGRPSPKGAGGGGGGAAEEHTDWRAATARVDISAIERKGVELHKEREAAARACSC